MSARDTTGQEGADVEAQQREALTGAARAPQAAEAAVSPRALLWPGSPRGRRRPKCPPPEAAEASDTPRRTTAARHLVRGAPAEVGSESHHLCCGEPLWCLAGCESASARILPRPWVVGMSGTVVFSSVAGLLWLVGDLHEVLHSIRHGVEIMLLLGSFSTMVISLFIWHIEERVKHLAEECLSLRVRARDLPRLVSGEVIAEVHAAEKRLVGTIAEAVIRNLHLHAPDLSRLSPRAIAPELSPRLPGRGGGGEGRWGGDGAGAVHAPDLSRLPLHVLAPQLSPREGSHGGVAVHAPEPSRLFPPVHAPELSPRPHSRGNGGGGSGWEATLACPAAG